MLFGRKSSTYCSKGKFLVCIAMNSDYRIHKAVIVFLKHDFFYSLHALKDESYIRQTLQKQAATLHTAAISYAVSIPE